MGMKMLNFIMLNINCKKSEYMVIIKKRQTNMQIKDWKCRNQTVALV